MKIHDLLAIQDISPERLARGMGLSRTRVAAMLKQRGAAWENVAKIAIVLGCEPENIAERTTLASRPMMAYGRWRE